MIKEYNILKMGIIISFLLGSVPNFSSAVQIYKHNGKTYYSPFSKVCTASEVNQFIEELFQDTHQNIVVADPFLPEIKMLQRSLEKKILLSRIVACRQKAIPTVINLLNSKNNERIRTALFILTEIGPEAEDAIPSLTRLLKHPDSYIKRLSAEALAAIGPAAKNTVPALIPLLQDISVLGNMGPAAKGAIPELITSSKSGSYDAGQALAKIGKEGILALIQFVVNDRNLNDSIRFTALNALDSIISERPDNKRLHIIIPSLINILQDKTEDSSIRFRMVSFLGEIGRDSEQAVSALIKVLRDGPSEKIQLKTAKALVEIGKGADAVPALIQMLDRRKEEPAAMAAEILGSIGEDALPAVPALITSLRPKRREADGSYWYGGREWSVQESAATALKQIGLPAVSYLIPLLSDGTDKVVRARAALTLGQIGTEARAAIPHLLPLLQQDKKTQLLAAIVLAELGAESETVLPVLIPALQVPNYEVRERVASAIGKLGESATSAVPALTGIIGYSGNAAEALIEIGSAAALSSLIKCLEEDRCHFALERKGSDAVPALIQALQSQNAEVRHRAASISGKIGKDAIPALQMVLQNKDSNIRQEAIWALGIINQPSPDIISSLEKILHESTDPDEQRLAASVLDIMEYNVSWFFSQNNLVSPRNAVCPFHFNRGKHYQRGYDSSFDLYTGQCLVKYNDMSAAMIARAVLSGLADFFSNDDKQR